MSIIDRTYFIGDCFIPQLGQLAVQEKVTEYINRYEPKVLTSLLGLELYQAFDSGLDVTLPATPDQRWLDLKEGKVYAGSDGRQHEWIGIANASRLISLVANYIYYWYSRSNASWSTGTGEVLPAAENGSRFSASNKMCQAWNEMVAMNLECVAFLEANKDVYPEWQGVSSGFYPSFEGYLEGCCYYGLGRRRKVKNDIFEPINALNL